MSSNSTGLFSGLFHSCEFFGSMFLVIAAVSPIILFNEVLGANIAIAVLANSVAVTGILFALIEIFSPICIAYFNPVVSLALALDNKITWTQAAMYTLNQTLGGFTGIILTHLMYYHRIPKLMVISEVNRSGGNYLSEILGTYLLVLAIYSLSEQRSEKTSLVIGLLVGGMLLATSSTMFANPQVVFSRMFTYSMAGVRPRDGAIFILMEVLGAVLAYFTWRNLEKTCKDWKSVT